MSGVAIGPFALERQIGEGGQGLVYLASHAVSRTPVAIKVLKGEHARDAKFVRAFLREVRAVARLTHPNIVQVFDVGTLDKEVEEASGRELTAGSPYLAMELLPGSTLEQQIGQPLDWEIFRELVHTILQALAHAHARGLVHRDLKPANISWDSGADVRGETKLMDFGIVHAVEQNIAGGGYTLSRTEVAVPYGTPLYMAPEQLEAKWRDFGPWTDFYALGNMLFEIVTGRAPFDDAGLTAVMLNHLRKPLPELEARYVNVPDGFDAWLRKMTEKDPAARFRTAADAARALAALSGSVATPGRRAEGGEAPSTGAASALDGRTRTLQLGDDTPKRSGLPGGAVTAAVRGIRDATGPQRSSGEEVLQGLPEDWRCSWSEGGFELPVGAGLGLFGIRKVSIVNRDEERRSLWNAVAATHKDPEPRVVLLRGAAGFGKSELARWLCEEAREQGVAETLVARHEPTAGPAHGLSTMMANHFGCHDMTREEAAVRLERHLRNQGVENEYEWQGLAELVTMGTRLAGRERTSGSVRFGNPAERYELLVRTLYRIARRRPVVCWLDDVQWGADSLGFVRHVLFDKLSDEARTCPVLFVLTLREPIDEERKLEREHMQWLSQHPRVQDICVGPLDDAHMRRLLELLLRTTGSVADGVVKRAAGNPLFAIQLLGDWVERGLLELRDEGFALRDGEAATIPDSIHDVWQARVAHLLRDVGQDDRIALELLAALGAEVEERDMRNACTDLGVTLSTKVLDRLWSRRLLLPTAHGIAFDQPLLRESLIRSARENDRWETINLACARMIARSYEAGTLRVAERKARHFREARSHDDAVREYELAVRERIESSEYDEGLRLCDELRGVLTDGKLDPADARWGRLDLHLADIQSLLWRFDEAERAADSALKRAEDGAGDVLKGRALALKALVARQRGDHYEAERLAEEAEQLLRDPDARQHLLRLVFNRAASARVQGRLMTALAQYEYGRGLATEIQDESFVAHFTLGLAHTHSQLRNAKRSEQLYHGAREIFDLLGNRQQVGNCINGAAEILRASGQLDDAETSYRQALEILRATGSKIASVTEINLCLIDIERGRYGEAAIKLLELKERFEEAGQQGYLCHIELARSVCAAGLGDLDAWQRLFERASVLIADTATRDSDLARLATLSGDLWARADARKEARRCYLLAALQLEALEDHKQARSARARAEGAAVER